MRTINLLTHLMAFNNIKDDTVFKKYAIVEGQNIKKKTRRDEEQVLLSFVDHLRQESDQWEDFDYYYWNYTIPHFGQEFDLLRLDDHTIIDIELKSLATKEKVLKQLTKNQHYLKALGLKVYCFSYVQDKETLYQYADGHLTVISFKNLLDCIRMQTDPQEQGIDEMMVPSQFLLSPFNQPLQFINEEYFLTSHQDVIKKDIQDHLKKRDCDFFGIKGDAGTGKTLLTYDLAKTLSQSARVLTIHCADLNSGQRQLIEYGMNIMSVKQIRHVNYRDYDVILVDEAQRLWNRQYDNMMKQAQKHKFIVIFSYDTKQTLSENDEKSEVIKDFETRALTYQLTNTIRTNAEIMRFVTNLFDLKKHFSPTQRYKNIDIVYFDDLSRLQSYIRYLRQKNDKWMFLNFNASPYDVLKDEEQGNAQMVIGQEFDDVVVFLDETFYYDQEGKLNAHDLPGIHYRQVKMLYQNITRARHQLKLVIVNNEDVFTKCVSIMSKGYSQR